MSNKLLQLLHDYSQAIDDAKSGFHNVNQWSEDLDDGTGLSYEDKIDLAYKKLEDAIKQLN